MKPTFYVAVYIHDREYGGPEEGGWWYDTYELVPEKVECFDNEAEARERQTTMQVELDADENVGRYRAGSVLSTGWYLARILDEFPPTYEPRERPYYS